MLFYLQHFHSDVQAHHNDLVAIQMASDTLSGLERRDGVHSQGDQAIILTKGNSEKVVYNPSTNSLKKNMVKFVLVRCFEKSFVTDVFSLTHCTLHKMCFSIK